MRKLAKCSAYVATDSEFPGIVAQYTGDYQGTFDREYYSIKANVDILGPIQIALSFFGQNGECVYADHRSRSNQISTLQFNLKWDIDTDPHAVDSIELLKDTGIDFARLRNDGIAPDDFGEALVGSGLVLNSHITWIGFHCAYDFAYLMKVITNWPYMPNHATEYQAMLQTFFPRILDLKSLLSEYRFFRGGLQGAASALGVERVGKQHQAGSDSLLAGETYFRFLERHCNGQLDPTVLNRVYGFNYFPFVSR